MSCRCCMQIPHKEDHTNRGCVSSWNCRDGEMLCLVRSVSFGNGVNVQTRAKQRAKQREPGAKKQQAQVALSSLDFSAWMWGTDPKHRRNNVAFQTTTYRITHRLNCVSSKFFGALLHARKSACVLCRLACIFTQIKQAIYFYGERNETQESSPAVMVLGTQLSTSGFRTWWKVSNEMCMSMHEL